MKTRRGGRFEVEWITISYRTLMRQVVPLVVLVAVAVGGLVWHQLSVRHRRASLAGLIAEIDQGVGRARDEGRSVARLEPIEVELASARQQLAAGQLAEADSTARRARALLADVREGAADRARLLSSEGDVQVKRVGSPKWLPAKAGMELDPGDLLRTGDDSAAQYANLDGSTGILGAQTLMRIARSDRNRESGTTDVAVVVNAGQLTVATRELWPGSTSEVKTPSVSAQVDSNSVIDIGVAADGSQSRVGISQGGALLTIADETVELVASDQLEVSGTSILRSKMPSAPGLVAPSQYKVLLSRDIAENHIELEWDSVPNARSYEIELARTPLFSRRLLRWTAVTTNYIEIESLPEGGYYWRVRALDRNEVAGPPSEAGFFRVSDVIPAGDPPFLEITSIQSFGEGLWLVEGATLPGVYLSLDVGRKATAVQPQESGRFRAILQIPEEGEHVVTVTARNSQGLETRYARRVEVSLP